MKTAVYRQTHFNSAHRLHNPQWSDEKNREIFGKCNLPNYHGHNYTLIVRVAGDVDPDTGYVIDTKELASLMKREIEDRFDHKNLNLDTAEFRNLNPTAENIARVIWELLRPHIKPAHQLQVRLYETERNFIDYPA
jgi:6-pyruvoyltetrahydropterin/6-carboxytetrahydropterin synthase